MKVLISLPEVAAALMALPQHEIDGVPHVDGDAFIAAMRALHPTVPAMPAGNRFDGPAGNFPPFPGDEPARLPPLALVDDRTPTQIADALELEVERARLRALPPGPCVCAQRFRTTPDDPRADPKLHVHPTGDCEACAQSSNPCAFGEYVDSTVRDPVQRDLDARGHGTVEGAQIEPLPHTDPVIDTRGRPASNANAFRPPSG